LTEQVFEDLFRSRFKPLVSYAMRFVRDMETARAIVQDAFTGLWEKRATVDTGREIAAYLTTTVRNRCLNYLRDEKKYNRDLIELEGLLSDEADRMPSDRIEMAQLELQIKTAIGELPVKCREVFELSRFHNMKYQQIALQLGISVKTVETQMSRALSHLKTRLALYLHVVGLVWIALKIIYNVL